ncbi:MAG: regulatory protein RecX [Anaerolineae bacterium]
MARTITALRRGKTRKNRIHVYLDEEFGFSLSEFVAAGLHVGQALDDDKIEALKNQDATNTAQERALTLLEHRPRSRAELVRRLRRAGFTAEATESAVGRLERVDLVDDEAFARFWVEQRLAFRPRSRRALRYELTQQGLSKEVIDRVLADVDDAQLAADVVERHLQSLESKRTRLSRALQAEVADVEPDKGAEELFKLLKSRGFDYRTIKDTLAGLAEEDSGPASPDDIVEDE